MICEKCKKEIKVGDEVGYIPSSGLDNGVGYIKSFGKKRNRRGYIPARVTEYPANHYAKNPSEWAMVYWHYNCYTEDDE